MLAEVTPGCRLGVRSSVDALTTFPPRSTHNSVRRWCAPDEALNLTLLSMEGVLGLCTGDDGGSCWEKDIMLGYGKDRAPVGTLFWWVQKCIHQSKHSANIYRRPVHAR